MKYLSILGLLALLTGSNQAAINLKADSSLSNTAKDLKKVRPVADSLTS